MTRATTIKGCPTTRRQIDVMLAHRDGAQPVPYRNGERHTVFALIKRGWLLRDPDNHTTRLTRSGVDAAEHAARLMTNKSVAAPSLVPAAEPAREKVPA